MTIKNLDSCPFCGCVSMIWSKLKENMLDIEYQPLCSQKEKCAAKKDKFYNSLDEAIYAWNTRNAN